MKKILLGLLASTAFAFAAHAQEAPKVATPYSPPLSSCGATNHCWTGWGAAPFASSQIEAFSEAKLGKFLADAVAGGKLPAELVPFIKNDIMTHAGVKNLNPFQYLTPGTHLDLMESRNGPMYDVTVGEIDLGKGKVEAAKAYGYSYQFKGVLYMILDPFTCGNWSLWHTPLPSPAPVQVAQEPCAEIDVTIPAGNYVAHNGLFARRQLTKVCRGIYGPGKFIVCEDACKDDVALDAFLKKGYLLKEQPNNSVKFKCTDTEHGCTVRFQEPMSVTERTDDDIFWLCITKEGIPVFWGKDDHWYSFVAVNGAVPTAYVGAAPTEWVKAGGVPRAWHTVDDIAK
jgi:hypothetical protein